MENYMHGETDNTIMLSKEDNCENLSSFLYNPLVDKDSQSDEELTRKVLSCLTGCAIKGKC